MANTTQAWQPDESQQRVINLQQGIHLVLAPPGCGKTQILTERVRLARKNGVNYADMLCLTFTNRAARGMVERIKANIDDVAAAEVYVGNVHRFCSRFLYDNGLIAAETSVIDDDDALSILARYTEEDEMKVAESFKRRRDYFEIIFLSHLMHQIAQAHPKNLRLHADCLSAEDVHAMRKLCELNHIDFTPQAMTDIYLHASCFPFFSFPPPHIHNGNFLRPPEFSRLLWEMLPSSGRLYRKGRNISVCLYDIIARL